MKPQALKMINSYLALVPKFIRSFFDSNEDVIQLRHEEYYHEVLGLSDVLGLNTSTLFMLNYAFELSKALCTSIVARQPDGKIIHGRNMDFGFADAVRDATFTGRFYRNGVF